jgi:predicted dehydrogenase
MSIRIVQVGMGGWGQNWAKEVVSANTDIEAVAWVELDAGTLKKAQTELKLPSSHCFLSLTDALSAVEADAVLVTASLPGHVPSVLTALQAGKHVLVEKPFAPTLAEASQLVEEAEQRGHVLMVSQNYRYHAAARAVADLVRRRILGEVLSVNLDFRKYNHKAPFETTTQYKFRQPLLVDMAIHHFDLMRMVLGKEPVQINCQTWNPRGSKFVDPAAGAAIITFEGDTIVSYRGNWVSPGADTNWAGAWHMECELGEIVWTSRGHLGESVILRSLDALAGETEQVVELPEVTLHDRHGSLAAFIHAIQTGIEPESSGRRNLKTLALTLASVASATNQRPITL